ncbi:MAG: hypothetical protein HYR91_06000 [Flavobacteriia bacterium]|nr:hypothetical protein [Flavobacteriia bacterium]
MRNSKSNTTNTFKVTAIAGTYVVLLTMDLDENSTKGLLGFSIYRKDLTEKNEGWLLSFKTFESTMPNPKPGELISSEIAPIQDFKWGDYTAKPNHSYVYKVIPVFGTPSQLNHSESIEIEVQTEDEDNQTHAIYFNRGAAGSQAYARKFGNKRPDEIGKEAYQWLSRGAEEAILSFIGLANNSSFSIRAAAYEFSHLGVLTALKTASENGADVKIVYDCRKDEPQATSNQMIDQVGIRNLMIPRSANPSYISHNKFIVLLKDNQPIQVLTGSTNFTDGGIYGQSNVVHIVRDIEIASQYLNYWTILSQNTDAKLLRPWTIKETNDPLSSLAKGIHPIFSPRSSENVLNWYAQQIDKAESFCCFTAAFGVNKTIASYLTTNTHNKRYIMLEKKQAADEIYMKNSNNFVSIGEIINQSAVGDSEFHRWLGEKLTGLNNFVNYLHTKYLLQDPLSENPLIISGSANFSTASTINNDENMLLIQGNTMVSDIYLGEFMRLWDHFYFRDIAGRLLKTNDKSIDNSNTLSPYLWEDDRWTKDFFGKDYRKTSQREMFSKTFVKTLQTI